MNIAAIQRIAWKELRQQFAFFIALLLIAVIALIVLRAAFSSDPHSAEWPIMGFGLFSAMFAAASGGVLFAAEKEENTRLHLQMLPLSGRELAIGKIGIALLLSLVFFGLCIGIAWLAGATPSHEVTSPVDATVRASSLSTFCFNFGLATLEFFAWSLLISLLTRQPLAAALGGIAAASLSISLSALFSVGTFSEPYALATYLPTYGLRGLIVTLLFGIDFWLATRWLQPSKSNSRNRPATLDVDSRSFARNTALRRSRAGMTSEMSRHTWQTLRTSWPWMLLLLPLFPLSVLIGKQLGTIALMSIAGSISGVLVFSSDRVTQSNRFLSQCAARPGLYWLTVVSVWVTWLVVAVVVLSFAFVIIAQGFLDYPMRPFTFPVIGRDTLRPINESWPSLADIVSSVLLATTWWMLASLIGLSSGQFFSILLERRIPSAFCAILVAIPLGIWTSLVFASGIPMGISYFPLLAAFLFVGWTATRYWLNDRLSIWRKAVLLGIATTFWASLSVGSILYRMHEIPPVNLDLAEYRFNIKPLPDLDAIAEMRRRLAQSALDQPLPGSVFLRIGDLLDEAIDAKSSGVAIGSNPVIGKSILNNEIWQSFLELHRSETPETQLEKVRRWISIHETDFQEFSNALQFAISHVDDVMRLPPWVPGTTHVIEPPLPDLEKSQTSQALDLRFQVALLDGDSETTWDALRDIIYFRSLEAQIYASPNIQMDVIERAHQWLAIPGATEADIREANQIVQEPWFLYPSLDRALEKDHIALRHAIQTGNASTVPPYRLFQHRVTQTLARIPGERQRALRLVDAWAYYVKNGHKAWLSRYRSPHNLNGLGNLAANTLWFGIEYSYPRRLEDFSKRVEYDYLRQNEFKIETKADRLMALFAIKIAALVYQLDHGKLPESMADLGDQFRWNGPQFCSFQRQTNPNSNQFVFTSIPDEHKTFVLYTGQDYLILESLGQRSELTAIPNISGSSVVHDE